MLVCEVLLLFAVGDDVVELDTGEFFVVEQDVIAIANGVSGPVGFLGMRTASFPEDGSFALEGYAFERGEHI